MLNPSYPGGYAEIDDTSATKEMLDSQTADLSQNRPVLNFLESGERTFLSPADLSMMAVRPSSAEIGAAYTGYPSVVSPDSSVRFDSDRQTTSSPLKDSRVQASSTRPGAPSTRRMSRPLALVPRLTRQRPESLRAPAKISLMGVRIDCVTEQQVITRILSSIRQGRGGWIVTPNVDHLRIINQRPDLLAMLSEASLMVADGMPLIWASRLKGTPLPERVPGAGLILSLTAAASRAGASIFLLGGNPGDAEAAAAILKRLNKGLKVAGIMCPPFGFDTDPMQMSEVSDALRSAKPDIVYSCFGFPKEQFVIQALRRSLPAAWFLGLGGSFAIVSGRTRRAPIWVQSIGMEWVWRLGLEPRRLFGRYIVNDLPFAIRLLANAIVQH